MVPTKCQSRFPSGQGIHCSVASEHLEVSAVCCALHQSTSTSGALQPGWGESIKVYPFASMETTHTYQAIGQSLQWLQEDQHSPLPKSIPDASLLPRTVSPVQSKDDDDYAYEQSFLRGVWETDHLPGAASYRIWGRNNLLAAARIVAMQQSIARNAARSHVFSNSRHIYRLHFPGIKY